MKRRSFVKTSVLTAFSAGISNMASRAMPDSKMKKTDQEYYELRVYHLKNDSQQRLVEDYFRTAAIPTLNRLGSKNIGVFTEMEPQGQTKIYVLIPFSSIEDFIKVQEKLPGDETYKKAAGAYLNAPATDPAYERIQSSLLRAFAGMPKLEVPSNKPRIFELRRYESASESAGKNKIEMFNDLGEISIFKRVGLTPVFFGETLVGEMRPNLTYMITYDDKAEHDRNWKIFGSDPEWKKIRANPDYADAKIVSKITATFLIPASFSQI